MKFKSLQRLRGGLVMIAIASCAGLLIAQERANFSGTWVATTEKPQGIDAAPSAILGPRFALRLEGDSLTVTRPIREESIPVTFKLDATKTSFRVPGRMCEGDSEFIETAAWEGSAIALIGLGRIPPGGGPPSQGGVRRLLRLEGKDTLIVEGNMTQAGVTKAVASVYKRSADALPAPKPRDGVKGAAATIAQVSWISGMWVGSTQSNVQVEERWTPSASGSILGIGRRLRGNLMSSFEFLCIAERDGSLVYTAMPDGRTTPTHFTLTSISADNATFENPTHDYPKVIRYILRSDGSLETVIAGAGGQRSLSFVLKRQQ